MEHSGVARSLHISTVQQQDFGARLRLGIIEKASLISSFLLRVCSCRRSRGFKVDSSWSFTMIMD